jgi:hypothetical protein
MNRITGLIAIVFVCGILSLGTTCGSAFAQAGSTGGTIGKKGKSVSGGDDTTRETQAKRPAQAVTRHSPVSRPASCKSVHSTWSVDAEGLGSATMTVMASGMFTTQGLGNPSGSFNISGRTVKANWRSSDGYSGVTRVELSSDCTHGRGISRQLTTPPGVAPRQYSVTFTRTN